MKSLVFLISIATLLLFTNTICAQEKKIVIKEFHYAVNEKGEIDKETIVEQRRLVYHKNKGLISVESSLKSSLQTPASESTQYYNLPDIKCLDNSCKYDENNRIIEYTEQLNNGTTIQHAYNYNYWGDLVEDKSIILTKGEEPQAGPALTYEYFYLDDFSYSKKDRKKFISEMKANYNNSWVLRTIKKDGLIVQHTERKIRN